MVARATNPPATTSSEVHRASAPTEVLFTGWREIFWRLYQQVQEDRVLAVAAGVVFYMLLALFPVLAVLVSLSRFVHRSEPH